MQLAANLQRYYMLDIDLSATSHLLCIELMQQLDLIYTLRGQNASCEFLLKDIQAQGISLLCMQESIILANLFIPITNIKCIHTASQWISDN